IGNLLNVTRPGGRPSADRDVGTTVHKCEQKRYERRKPTGRAAGGAGRENGGGGPVRRTRGRRRQYGARPDAGRRGPSLALRGPKANAANPVLQLDSLSVALRAPGTRGKSWRKAACFLLRSEAQLLIRKGLGLQMECRVRHASGGRTSLCPQATCI